MVLDVLAGGEVAPTAAELVGDPAQLRHLGGGQQAAGNLAADHLDSRLPLPVDTMLEAEGAKIVFRDFTGKECLGGSAEGFDLFANGPGMLRFERFALMEVFLNGGRHNHLQPDRD
jgi:hypothetical protein